MSETVNIDADLDIAPRISEPTGSSRRLFYWTILISLLINLVALYIAASRIELWKEIAEVVPDEHEIEFRLVDEKDLQKPKQVIENMTANEIIPENADLLSDKSSLASDLLEQKLPPGEAYNPGTSSFVKDITQPGLLENLLGKEKSAEPAKEEVSSQNFLKEDPKASSFPFLKKDSEKKSFSKDALTGGSSGSTYDNTKSASPFKGDFTLSTVAWEWAPFMNTWKAKILDKWYKMNIPPAYFFGFDEVSKGGIVQVYVKVSRDGKILDCRITDFTTHKSLVNPAFGAINNSFPLKALPADFPEEYLEVTWFMHYPDISEMKK